jgi:hypothetical protein
MILKNSNDYFKLQKGDLHINDKGNYNVSVGYGAVYIKCDIKSAYILYIKYISYGGKR